MLGGNTVFSRVTWSRSNRWVFCGLSIAGEPGSRDSLSLWSVGALPKGKWPIPLTPFCRRKTGHEQTEPKPSLSLILKETNYVIARSRQTRSQRQISFTPWYPGAQSILIKKRFWLLHGSESRASCMVLCPQREAASSIAEVQWSSRASPPSFPPTHPPPPKLYLRP